MIGAKRREFLFTYILDDLVDEPARTLFQIFFMKCILCWKKFDKFDDSTWFLWHTGHVEAISRPFLDPVHLDFNLSIRNVSVSPLRKKLVSVTTVFIRKISFETFDHPNWFGSGLSNPAGRNEVCRAGINSHSNHYIAGAYISPPKRRGGGGMSKN